MLFRLFTVLAVAALAVSTWILSSPGRRPAADAGTEPPELPGYFLKDALLTDFDAAGRPSIQLKAQRIDQVDHTSEVTLSAVRVDYRTAAGQNWTMVGDNGRMRPGGDIIDISGNVLLQGDGTTAAGTAIVHTDALSYDVPRSIVTSQEEVRMDFGAHTLTAHGMRADLKARTLHLEPKVNGRFQR